MRFKTANPERCQTSKWYRTTKLPTSNPPLGITRFR